MTRQNRYDPPQPHVSWRETYGDELASIQARRRSVFPHDPSHSAQSPRPEHLADLVGLALSGGGIRSATFCLGVLQGLAERGILKHVDYLSTVSGGGYIGAWFLALVSRVPGIDAAIEMITPASESRMKHSRADSSASPDTDGSPIEHLRAFSNYLAPKAGFFTLDIWALIALFVCNLVVAQLSWVPLVVFGMLVLQMIATLLGPEVTGFVVLAVPAIAAGLALLWVAMTSSLQRGNSLMNRENQALRGARLLMFAIVWIGLLGISIYGDNAVVWMLSWKSDLMKSGVLGSLLLSTLSSLFFGRSADFNGKSRAGLFERIAMFGPFVFLLGAGCLLSWVAALCLETSGSGSLPIADLGAVFRTNPAVCCVFGLAIVSILLSLRLNINDLSLNNLYANRLTRCYLGASRLHFNNSQAGFDSKDDIWLSDLAWHPPRADTAVTRGYALSDPPTKGTVANDTPVCQGPFPIINTTLNLAGDSNPATQERLAESFFMTPLAVGSTSLQSCRNYWNGQPRHGRLGRLIAISGAAANPNMGYHSSPGITALMTLFNIRLGWWLANPAGMRGMGDRPGSVLIWMLKELFGRTDAKADFINLSDGGHFDNLGIYELVRRHCRLIIAVDAEADPDGQFHGLGTVIRRCRNDFGVDIEIDVDPLRRSDTTGHSRQHAVVGTIRYPQVRDSHNRTMPCEGTLVYIKATLTGDESTDVLQYAQRHEEFPHEPTLDQFFSESQFESYRALGLHSIRKDLAVGHALDQEPFPGSVPPGSQDTVLETLETVLRRTWRQQSADEKADLQPSMPPFVSLRQLLRDEETLARIARYLGTTLTSELPGDNLPHAP